MYFLLSFVFLTMFSSAAVWAKTDADCELLEAVRRESIQDAKRALKAGAHVDIQDDNHKTSLMIAIENEDTKMVKFLLDHKPNLEIEDYNGWTALMRAVYDYDDCNCCEYYHDYEDPINIVRLLLEHGAHVNKVHTIDGYTPLMLAAAGGSIRLVELLLDHGADVHAADSFGCTALFYVEDDNLDDDKLGIVELLIKHGADVNVKGGVGFKITPLINALWNDDAIEIVQLLLDHGADVHVADSFGCTALFYAVNYASDEEDLEKVKLLVQYGADVNVKCNKDLKTPLMCTDEIEIVKFLLDHGADVHAKDRFGKTALQEARENNSLDIVQLLLAYGAQY